MTAIYRVSLFSTKGTIQCANTFHYAADDPGSATTRAQDILTQFLAKVQTKYAAVLGTDSVLTGASCTQELAPSDTSPPDHYEVTLNVPGTRLGIDTFTSPALCALARFPTNAAVKGAHGHAFMPPASSSSALGAGATWKPTDNYFLNCKAFCDELKNGFNEGVWWDVFPWKAWMVVYSKTRRQRADPNYWFDVINASVDSSQRWLRSRTK